MNANDRTLFYTAFLSLLEAGFSPVRALRGVMPQAFRRAAEDMAVDIERGATLTQAMQNRSCFSHMEIALIHAGEIAGRLPESCRQLVEYFDEQKALRARMIHGFIYPLFLYHFAGFVFTLLRYVGGQQCGCLRFLVIWSVAPWVAFLLWKLLAPLRHSTPVSLLINVIPFFGGLQFQRECGRFLVCFGRCLGAGMGMDASIGISAGCCHSRLFQADFEKIARKQADNHLPFTACVLSGLPKEMPDDVLTLLQTGELSGQLPLYAERSAKLLLGRASAKLILLARVLPWIFYIYVAIQIALRVIGFYMGYINSINSLME